MLQAAGALAAFVILSAAGILLSTSGYIIIFSINIVGINIVGINFRHFFQWQNKTEAGSALLTLLHPDTPAVDINNGTTNG